MSATENVTEVSLPSTEFQHQPLIITASFDYKKPISP